MKALMILTEGVPFYLSIHLEPQIRGSWSAEKLAAYAELLKSVRGVQNGWGKSLAEFARGISLHQIESYLLQVEGFSEETVKAYRKLPGYRVFEANHVSLHMSNDPAPVG